MDAPPPLIGHATANPYDELPYRSLPIEWTAPERLALASLLHGGPRAPLDAYRVLELGCGDGSNLLPMAYYRRHATFVGLDGAGSAIAAAHARASELGLSNVELVHADFLAAAERLTGEFDYVIVHGVLSWVTDAVRDAVLALCARCVRPGGLVYVNYNTKPGWNVRGMVRDFLRAQTAGTSGLRARAKESQAVAAKVAASLAAAPEHPYMRLMEREFRIVCDGALSYIAHEYLAPDNRAYWRSEFLALAQAHGLRYVADADYNYGSGRVPGDLRERIADAQLLGQSLDDTADLLSYRQMHSPILAHGAWTPRLPDATEFGELVVASCLAPVEHAGTGPRLFRHPSGFEVEAREAPVWRALERVLPHWPRGMRVGALFADVASAIEDLVLLHRHGMLDLRLIEPGDFAPPPGPLHAHEARWAGSVTTPYHTRVGGAT